MSSEQDNTRVPVTSSEERLLGQVKWFNNKAGYGFITVNYGEYSGKDIFIHYSAIRVTNSQYKYLVQGEYVEFNLVKSNSDTHEYQATDISGVKGGALMCETRRNSRPTDVDSTPRPPRVQSNTESKGDGFTQVRRRRLQGNRPRKETKPSDDKAVPVESA